MDAARTNGTKGLPPRLAFKPLNFRQGPVFLPSAATGNDHIGIGSAKIVIAYFARTAAGPAEKFDAACHINQFGNPVARTEQRIKPFQEDHARSGWREAHLSPN